MKKARPIILIITTLIIGFFIGILTSAQLRHKKMKSVRIYSSGSQLKHTMYRHLDPTEEQIEKLDVIFDDLGSQNRKLQIEFRKNFEELMEANWSKIKPLLSKEQLEKLEQLENERREATIRYRSDSSRNSSYRKGDRNRRDSSNWDRNRNDRNDGSKRRGGKR